MVSKSQAKSGASQSAIPASLGRTIGNIAQVDPRMIDVVPQFNFRSWSPDREADIDLKTDIVTNGYDMTQPVMVARGKDNRFKLIRGHRRLGAVMSAIADKVDIRFISATLESGDLAENEPAHYYDLIRSNGGVPPTDAEAGVPLRRLVEVCKIPVQEVAKNIGKSDKWVYACIKAAKSDRGLRGLVEGGRIAGTLVQKFTEAHGIEATKRIVAHAEKTGGVKKTGKKSGQMTASTLAASEKAVTGKTTVTARVNRNAPAAPVATVATVAPPKGRQDATTNGALLDMTTIEGPFAVGGPDDCEIWDRSKASIGYGSSPVLTRAIVDMLNAAHDAGLYARGKAPVAFPEEAPGGNVTQLRAAAAKVSAAPSRKGKRRH